MRHDPRCPVADTISLISGKWKPSILLQLKDGAKHFNQLRRDLPQVTQRIMTLQLRALERDGIVVRSVTAGNPPRVEYAISSRGRTLGPALQTLEEWGEHYLR